MSKFCLGVLVGSLRQQSINLKLAKILTELSHDRFDSHFIQIGDLPLFNQDLEANRPESVLRLKQEIEVSDAVLFVTPEYNRSIPSPLVNALDWASRPYGANSFAQKPGAIIGTSQGTLGTVCAQQSLRLTLSYLDMALMNQPEAYIQFKEPFDETATAFLKKYMDSFALWIEKTKNKSST
ncbi:MAG: NADPH-dependent FMN reductase [Myxococcaceae bacterium]